MLRCAASTGHLSLLALVESFSNLLRKLQEFQQVWSTILLNLSLFLRTTWNFVLHIGVWVSQPWKRYSHNLATSHGKCNPTPQSCIKWGSKTMVWTHTLPIYTNSPLELEFNAALSYTSKFNLQINTPHRDFSTIMQSKHSISLHY